MNATEVQQKCNSNDFGQSEVEMLFQEVLTALKAQDSSGEVKVNDATWPKPSKNKLDRGRNFYVGFRFRFAVPVCPIFVIQRGIRSPTMQHLGLWSTKYLETQRFHRKREVFRKANYEHLRAASRSFSHSKFGTG